MDILGSGLLTAEDLQALPGLYATEGMPAERHMAQVKLFHPASAATWYLLEADAILKDGTLEPLCSVRDLSRVEDVQFFGYVTGLCVNEFGVVNLSDLAGVRVRGLGVERDLYYRPESLATIQAREG